MNASLSRRHWLGLLSTTVLGVPACFRQAAYQAGAPHGGQILVPAPQLAALQGPADVLYVRADGLPGVLAVRKQGSDYVVVQAVCTHRSCELSAGPQSYDCSCHGSRFDLNGEVLEGPADRPLPRLRAAREAAGLTIQVG